MKALKILNIAVVALLVVAVVQPVAASCGGPTLIGTKAGPALGQASFVWTDRGAWITPGYLTGNAPFVAGQAPWTGVFDGQWWALGTGDPLPGAGDDSNTWGVDNWAYYYTVNYQGTDYYYGGEMFGGWGQSSEIDGCIVNNGPAACTCIALTDRGSDASWLALLGAAGDDNFTTFFDQPGTDGAGNAGPIILQLLLGPDVTATTTNGVGVDVTIDVATPTGVYLKDGCACDQNMAYKILALEVPHGSPPPATRVASAWTVISAGLTAVGSPGTATATCTSSADVDLYVTYELVFDTQTPGGGMPQNYVAGNSTVIACGSNPTLADPVDVRPRVRPDAPLEPRRGGKSGGRKG